MSIIGPRRNPTTARTVIDGQALALLLLAAICAERFDRARGTIHSLRSSEGNTLADSAAPAWLWPTWAIVAVAGGLVALYVGLRAIRIVEGIKEARSAGAGSSGSIPRSLPPLVYGAIMLWLAWQAVGIAVVHGESISNWISLGLHVGFAGAVVLALGTGGAVLGNVKGAFKRASVVRVQLLFLLALFLIVFIAPFTSGQLSDVLRAWGDEGAPASRAIAGIAAALLLGAVCRASATRLLTPSHRLVTLPQRLSPGKHHAEIVGLSAGVLAVVLLIAGLEAAAFLAFAVGLTAAGTRSEPPHGPEPGGPAERSLRRFAGTIGVAPLAILLVGVVGAAVDSLLLPSGPTSTDKTLFVWTVVVVVVFGLLAARAHAAGGTPGTTVEDKIPAWAAGVAGFATPMLMLWEPEFGAWLLLALAVLLSFRLLSARGAPELWGGWGVALGVALSIYLEPIEAARAVGAFGLALVGATGILVVLHLLGLASHRRLTAFGDRTIHAPVVIVILVWGTVAFLTAPPSSHQAPTIAVDTRPGSLDVAVTAWLERQAPRSGRPQEVPMLIVAASGGGSKAAYWTDLVLDCIFGSGAPPEEDYECAKAKRDRVTRRRWRSLLLTSSVSGGSIGIHHLVRNRPKILRGQPWVDDAAGRELLSPVVGWGMFHDLPAFLLGLPTDPQRCDAPLSCPLNADRALVQEVAVDGEDRSAASRSGLLDQKGPIVVLNATQGAARGRVVLSRLDLAAPASCRNRRPLTNALDGHDMLDRQDVAMVTGALLSARFPLLEPAGRLGHGSGERAACATPPPIRAVTLRDGGLIENTGLLTVAELLPAIQRAIARWKHTSRHAARARIRPIVVSIDDDVPGVKGDDEYSHGLLRWLNKSHDRSVRARRTLCRFPGMTYRRISPKPHVGAQAATGFEISRTSRREDLGDSLRTGRAGATVRELREMLDGRLPPPSCERASGSGR